MIKKDKMPIERLESQMESFVNPDSLGEIPEPVSFEQVDLDMVTESRTVTLVFLATQYDDFSKAITLLNQKPDEVYLAHRQAFDSFRDAVQEGPRGFAGGQLSCGAE